MIPPRSQPIQPFMSRVEHSEDVALIIKIFAIVSAQCTKNKNICSPRVFEGNELKLMSSYYGVLCLGHVFSSAAERQHSGPSPISIYYTCFMWQCQCLKTQRFHFCDQILQSLNHVENNLKVQLLIKSCYYIIPNK